MKILPMLRNNAKNPQQGRKGYEMPAQANTKKMKNAEIHKKTSNPNALKRLYKR